MHAEGGEIASSLSAMQQRQQRLHRTLTRAGQPCKDETRQDAKRRESETWGMGMSGMIPLITCDRQVG